MYIKKTLALLFIACVMMGAVSCNRETAPTYNGIPMKDSLPSENYDQKSIDFAQNVIEDFLISLANEYSSVVKDSIKGKIPFLKNSMVDIFVKESNDEASFVAFFEDISADKEIYSKLLYRFLNNNMDVGDVDLWQTVFQRFFYVFGTDSISSIIKDFIICDYDLNISIYEKRANELTTPALVQRYKALAEKEKEKKDIFCGINDKSFVTLSKMAIFSLGFTWADSDYAQTLTSFTDAEICEVLKTLYFNMDLSYEEWGVLFELAQEVGNFGPIFKTIIEVDDVKTVADSLNLFFDFLMQVQKDLSAEDINKYRNTDKSIFIPTFFDIISDDNVILLDKALSIKLNNSEYKFVISSNAPLKEYFSVETKTLNDLKTASMSEVNLILRGIIRGIFYD